MTAIDPPTFLDHCGYNPFCAQIFVQAAFYPLHSSLTKDLSQIVNQTVILSETELARISMLVKILRLETKQMNIYSIRR